MNLPIVDVVVIVAYLLGTVAFGCWFVSRSRTPEGFTTAHGNVPSVVVGLSIFGTYVSSISFLALPGQAFMTNWNSFIPGLTLPICVWIAARWFVPFYRNCGNISAYSHFEARFGIWARIYATCCYMLTQVVRMGSILFLVALPFYHLLGWDIVTVIIVIGTLTMVYSMLGGIEGVIWTDAIQAVVLIAGAILCVIMIPLKMPEGPSQILRIAADNSKFSLGSVSPTLTESTVWVIFVYGIVMNLQNFGVDQNFVQRYLTSKSERNVKKSLWLGAMLYLPASAFFFLIGTSLFAFYTANPNLLPQELWANIAQGKGGDGVFPYFIVHELPQGCTGLVLAAILAAAMSTVSTSINGCATLTLVDFYSRFFRPNASSREKMWVLYISSFCCGILGIGGALVMIHAKGILNSWWTLSGIFSGGMLGLFLLGFLSRRATGTAAGWGISAGILVIMWMSLSLKSYDLLPKAFEPIRCPLHGYLISVAGTMTILFVGFIATLIGSRLVVRNNQSDG